MYTRKQMVDASFFVFIPEYRCLTVNLSMASSVPLQSLPRRYVFDCRYHTRNNRPIFRQDGGSMYLFPYYTTYWMLGPDLSRFAGYIQIGISQYLPFAPLESTAAYLFNSTWNTVTANVMRFTCIEDNNY